MSDLSPQTFVQDWINAWNRSDAEAILAHFADDAVFVSALAATVTGKPEVHGKTALRAYWTKALGLLTFPLRFQLDSFVWDEEHRAILIVYLSIEPNRTVRKSELMHFGPDGLIHRGEGFSGATVTSAN
jgi:ketosteroid isomerase-like protein